MSDNATKQQWEEYCKTQCEVLAPRLTLLGYTLDSYQPHVLGERFLTRPLGGGRKLVLLGHSRTTHERVVIKVSDESQGRRELAEEHTTRVFLERIAFAYEVFRYPKELLYITQKPYTFLITEFIEQDRPFLDRTIEDQFAIALRAFKKQESAHATTDSHWQMVAKHFTHVDRTRYIADARRYRDETAAHIPMDASYRELVVNEMSAAARDLAQKPEILDQYGGFLTHWDFTPQNFRVRDGELYLLDHGSIRFGNKYESWARFVNFMELYHPTLAAALVQYVHDNRAPEESEALRSMRLFRLMELIRYYTSWLARTEGALRTLTHARLEFWAGVLHAVRTRIPVPPALVETYRITRDALRSEDEKQRQAGLH